MFRNIIEEERGFTLIEMVVVIAVLAIVITMMTSLLLIPTKIAKSIKYEGSGRNTATLINSHITQSIRKNGKHGAVSLIDESGFNNVLKIERYDSSDGKYLFYFYNDSDKTVYFQTADTFTPSNLDDSMRIAEQVKDITFVLNPNQKELKISIDAYQEIEDEANVFNTKSTIALKSN